MISGDRSKSTMPLIDIWYGRRQCFGKPGLAQRWINILGRIHRPAEVATLVYTLNGGAPLPLTMGPDKRRLVVSGDFNIEINYALLQTGENSVGILAALNNGEIVEDEVIVDYHSGYSWPLPYTIDWSTAQSIQDVAVITDGLWTVEQDKLYPVDNFYDRVIAIGDVNWKDYEISVPVTLYGFNASAYQFPSVAPVIGFVMRWQGHYSWGADAYASGQPRHGFAPCGALGLYGWSDWRGRRLNIVANDGSTVLVEDTSGFKMRLGITYVMKMSVQSRPGKTSLYSLKAWPQDENEPDGWVLEAEGRIGEHSRGSVILLSHHTAAAFGNVSVRAV